MMNPIVLYAQIEDVNINKQNYTINTFTNDEGKWTFNSYPNSIIKVTFTPNQLKRGEVFSDAVVQKQEILYNYSNALNQILINDTFKITYVKPNMFFSIGKIKLQLKKTEYSDSLRGFDFNLESDEMIFGGGERSLPINRRGYRLPLYNNPWYGYSTNADALNFSMPFFISNKQYGIFFDNPSTGYMDIGKADNNTLSARFCSGEMNFYIIHGCSEREITERFQQLTGKQPLPPRWAMGNLMSRFGYRSEKQVRSVIQAMRKDSIPFDAVIFDLFWFGDSIKKTMGNLSWVNKKAWPNPQKMISEFRNDHIKTILITEPFVLKTSSNYEASKQLHATDSLGKPYVLKDFYFGDGGLLDIFRKEARNWFFEKYRKLRNMGVSGWWGDLGEPEKHPKDMYHTLSDSGYKRKFSAEEVHNIYGHYWSKMLYDNIRKKYQHDRIFHLNRSGYAGSPRYSGFPWSGDVSRSWDGLKAQLPLIQGMSMSGVPYIHSDAGGFAGGDGDAELYVRWLQFAAFTPIYRPHGTALGDLEPNAKDIPSEAALWPEPTKSLAKAATYTRYRWLPYNYTLCYQQAQKGKPLVSPMFYLPEKDSNLYKAGNQYLWGENVMVVPITEKEAKSVDYYVPNGHWTNMNDFRVLQGPQWKKNEPISMQNIPVYAKEGSFIPMAEPMLHTDEYKDKKLMVYYLPSTDSSSYDLFEDDGSDAQSLQNNLFELTHFEGVENGKQVSINISCNGGKHFGLKAKRKMEIRVPNINAHQHVSVNGQPVADAYYDPFIKGFIIPITFEHQTVTITIEGH
jgi:oligosaccharide 4-alpha-D-glucosyltransferase